MEESLKCPPGALALVDKLELAEDSSAEHVQLLMSDCVRVVHGRVCGGAVASL